MLAVKLAVKVAAFRVSSPTPRTGAIFFLPFPSRDSCGEQLRSASSRWRSRFRYRATARKRDPLAGRAYPLVEITLFTVSHLQRYLRPLVRLCAKLSARVFPSRYVSLDRIAAPCEIVSRAVSAAHYSTDNTDKPRLVRALVLSIKGKSAAMRNFKRVT